MVWKKISPKNVKYQCIITLFLKAIAPRSKASIPLSLTKFGLTIDSLKGILSKQNQCKKFILIFYLNIYILRLWHVHFSSLCYEYPTASDVMKSYCTLCLDYPTAYMSYSSCYVILLQLQMTWNVPLFWMYLLSYFLRCLEMAYSSRCLEMSSSSRCLEMSYSSRWLEMFYCSRYIGNVLLLQMSWDVLLFQMTLDVLQLQITWDDLLL